jgi:CTP synthase
VGDIESMVFLEALRQFQFSLGRENVMFVHVSLVPCLGADGEQKTKPTQHTVKELRSLGISPDVIVCRSSAPLHDSTKAKISGFCHVPPDHVIAVHDVSNIYHVPLILAEQGIQSIVRERLSLESVMNVSPDLVSWRQMAEQVDHATAVSRRVAGGGVADADPISGDPARRPIRIALVGKYTGLQDAYLSVVKSIRHSAILLSKNADVSISWVEASDLEPAAKLEFAEDEGSDQSDKKSKHDVAWGKLRDADGILVPGGFGNRGIEGELIINNDLLVGELSNNKWFSGMILACQYARENKKPYLGICLGLQVMVIEFARNVLHWTNANSTEFDERAAHPVVVFMPEINQHMMGGTMRLGARATMVSRAGLAGESTIASAIYGCSQDADVDLVVERHRHRYEINPVKVDALQAAGLVFSGKDEKAERMEICELPTSAHPFMFSVQFHPEFKSRPYRPSPPFFAFLAESGGFRDRIHRAGSLWREYEAAAIPALCSPFLRNPMSSPKVLVKSRSKSVSGGSPSALAVSNDVVVSDGKRPIDSADGESDSVKKRRSEGHL